MAKLIGEILIEKKLIREDQLDKALQEHMRSGKFLGEVVVDLGFVKEKDLLEALADQFNTRFVKLEDVCVNPNVIKLVPRSLVFEYKFLPIEMRSAVLLIAIANPLDMWPMSVVRERLDLAEVHFVIATRGDIKQSILKYYGRNTGEPNDRQN